MAAQVQHGHLQSLAPCIAIAPKPIRKLRYPDYRGRVYDHHCSSPSAISWCSAFKHTFPPLRVYLALVKVGRNGNCLVCSALSKAPAAVEGVTDPKRASSKVHNGQKSSRKVSSAAESASRTSRSSAVPENGGTSATDTADAGWQLRGKTGTWPSHIDNESAEQSRTEATSATANNSSTQDSNATSRQSAAANLSKDSSSEERRLSNSRASTSTAFVEDELPRRTVRLIRGPGGSVRRAEPEEDSQQSVSAPGARGTPSAGDSDDERSGAAGSARRTVRLVRGPGGQMVDARRISGWITAPDGSRAVCPRCKGRAFIRLGEGGPLKACPVCQQGAGSGSNAGLVEPSRGQVRRSNRSRRKPLSEEHKEKIRAALAGRKRKPLDEEHKRRIAESMLRNNADFEARQARSEGSMGVAKTCTVCGMTGHNRRTCPMITESQAPAKKTSALHPKPENAPVYKGVTWSATNGQWRAQAWDGKKIQYLDHFDDPEEAARAYDVAVLEWRGDKAVTNFPAETYFGEGGRSMDAEDSASVSKVPAAQAAQGAAAEDEAAQLDPVAQERASSEQLASRPAPADTAAAGENSSKAAEAVSDAFAQPQGVSTDAPASQPVEQSSRTDMSTASAISPLIAIEQSSADISAADLAGKPAGSAEDDLAASAASAYSASVSEAEEPPRRASRSRRLRSAEAAGAPPLVFDLPMTRDEAIQGAVQGIRRAWAAGVTRQKVELLLPGDMDGRGYPGGIKQQFVAVRDMVEAILLQLKQLPDFQGRLDVQWLDESDCVGAWESDTMAAVVLPTANTLMQLKAMAAAKGGKRLLLVVNPQWQMDGQIVSDFGFGQNRKEAESFVSSFEDVSVTQRLRMMGDDVRLFRCFPGAWQVHFIWPNGKGALLTGIEKERPSYERLLSALQGIPGSKASRSWVDRVNPFSGLGGGVSAKELLAAREDAERRAEMAQSRAAGSSWTPRPGTASASARAADKASEGALKGTPGPPSSKQRQPAQPSADDRFGEWDIITGKRVRDLRLEPVLQLAQWQQSLFGSRESTSGSLDEETQERD